MVQYGMRMRGNGICTATSPTFGDEVNNSKYMNELIMVECVYTSEETGGGQRLES